METKKEVDGSSSGPTPIWPSGSPVLYQINVRVLLRQLEIQLGRACSFDDIPNCFIERLANAGFNLIYLLGVWTTGQGGLDAARKFMAEVHPQVPQDEVRGSPFAVVKYEVHPDFGGPESLARFRIRLRSFGLSLLLDFVPNHVAFDHPFATVETSPFASTEALLLPGNFDLLHREPQNYFVVAEKKNGRGERKVMQGREGAEFHRRPDSTADWNLTVIAHGRDPYFDGWADTAQLNYFNKKLRDRMTDIILSISSQCDGIRCDMAHLLVNDVLHRTWAGRYKEATGRDPPGLPEFWSESIKSVTAKVANFKFMAEVYWDMEGHMMHLGFHYCYDKKLYDKLHANDAGAIGECLRASPDYQCRLTRFLENHDEDRAPKTFSHPDRHRAAALLTFLSPGVKFFHMGQLEGRTQRIPVQRAWVSERSEDDRSWGEGMEGDCGMLATLSADIYCRLLPIVSRKAVVEGEFLFANVSPSHHESSNHHTIFAFFRVPPSGVRETPLLIVVNFSPHEADGWVNFPTSVFPEELRKVESNFNPLGGPWVSHSERSALILRDIFGTTEVYRRDASEVRGRGVWFHLMPWGNHVMDLTWR